MTASSSDLPVPKTGRGKGSDGKLTHAKLAPADLSPNPRNPRNHNEDQLDRLMASLKRFGQPKPILVRAENRQIVAGHGIWTAAKRLGLPLIDVALWDVSEETANTFMLADNRLGDLSFHDPDRVADLLREINELDYMAVGFTEEEVTKILADIGEETLDVVEVETTRVADRYWISVRGPLYEQAEVLQHMKEVLKKYPETSVELGTVLK
jgi:ParB-like chromosome segregation protein Spo0J